MSDKERRYVLNDWMSRLIRIRGAAEELLPDVIGPWTLEVLDALLAEGRAAQTKKGKEEGEATGAAVTTSLAAEELRATTIAIRNIGLANFQRKNPGLYKQFDGIPVEAYTDQDILGQAAIADAVLGNVPNPETYQPKLGLTRAGYQAQIAEVQTEVGGEAKETSEAIGATADKNVVAVKTHDACIEWFAVADNSYPKHSPKWDIVQRTMVHEHNTEPAPTLPQV